MEDINLILGFSFSFMGVLIIALAIPLLLGKVKMNKFYGARVKKSFESSENWYKINKYSAKVMIIWSIPIVIIGILSFFITFTPLLSILFSILPIIIIICVLIQMNLYLKKI